MLKSQLPHKKSSKISKLLKSKNSSIFLNSTRLYAPSISINALRAREEPVFCSIWKDAIYPRQVSLLTLPPLTFSFSTAFVAKHDDVQYWSLLGSALP